MEGNLIPEIFGKSGTLERIAANLSFTGKPLHQNPPLDEFVMMLGKLFI